MTKYEIRNTMEEILMTPDVAMQFMVWSYYYHDIIPEKSVSYAKCGRFAAADVPQLDQLRDLLFKCFEAQSVYAACKQLQVAKESHAACPFTQEALDHIFAAEV